MLKRLLLLASMLVIFILPANVYAANTNAIKEISYSQQKTEDNIDYLQIKIGFKEVPVNYTSEIKGIMNNELLVNLPSTKLSTKAQMLQLDKKIGSFLNVEKLQGNLLQLKIYAKIGLNNEQYKVSVKKAQNKKELNYLIINIYSKPPVTYSALSNVKGKVIVIDPGHGGSDSGAIGPTGYMEKTATLAIAKKIEKELTSAGAKVILTRNRDVDVYGPNASAKDELFARAAVGNNNNADLFVSIHCNSFTRPEANGTQTFYMEGSAKGAKLAKAIQQQMVKNTKLRDRGSSTAKFFVLRYSHMPATLVETAFISNPKEEEILKSDKWQQVMADSISQGINNYFA